MLSFLYHFSNATVDSFKGRKLSLIKSKFPPRKNPSSPLKSPKSPKSPSSDLDTSTGGFGNNGGFSVSYEGREIEAEERLKAARLMFNKQRQEYEEQLAYAEERAELAEKDADDLQRRLVGAMAVQQQAIQSVEQLAKPDSR